MGKRSAGMDLPFPFHPPFRFPLLPLPCLCPPSSAQPAWEVWRSAVSSPSRVRGGAPAANSCDILSPENVSGGKKIAPTTYRYGSRQKEVAVWFQAGQKVPVCYRPTSSMNVTVCILLSVSTL